ncbi:phage holin family protein [Streptomyces sp. GSL17-111]|uniref:phage holin family protein n=1 Tax=Streptomyces sp. GSL17-111 TaxID=3121596 RepID=UPI0030F3CA64
MATSVGPYPGGQADVERLVREEIRRAKAEVREEARRARKAAGLLGAAVFAGYMVLCFLSLTLMFLLWGAMDLRWAALIVTGVWAVAGAVLFTRGRREARGTASAERTTETTEETS